MSVSYYVHPKHRKRILHETLKEDVRDVIIILCKYKDVEIIAGAIYADHVHLSMAISPKMSRSNFMGYLKENSLMIYNRHAELSSKWHKSFWIRGYYVETVGNIMKEAMQKYIKEQSEESRT